MIRALLCLALAVGHAREYLICIIMGEGRIVFRFLRTERDLERAVMIEPGSPVSDLRVGESPE